MIKIILHKRYVGNLHSKRSYCFFEKSKRDYIGFFINVITFRIDIQTANLIREQFNV